MFNKLQKSFFTSLEILTDVPYFCIAFPFEFLLGQILTHFFLPSINGPKIGSKDSEKCFCFVWRFLSKSAEANPPSFLLSFMLLSDVNRQRNWDVFKRVRCTYNGWGVWMMCLGRQITILFNINLFRGQYKALLFRGLMEFF